MGIATYGEALDEVIALRAELEHWKDKFAALERDYQQSERDCAYYLKKLSEAVDILIDAPEETL